MNWTISRYGAGDVVEVRSREEILATLDSRGCIDGMPFMPEMLRFCGQKLRVGAVAHKTCDTVRKTGGRRLERTVHLADLRCDGSAHGGCQAECLLFWKDEWLKPAAAAPGKTEPSQGGGLTVESLGALTVIQVPGEAEPRYVCQATQLYEATAPLPWWNVRQYVLDVTTRNNSFGRVVRVLGLASVRWFVASVPVGYRFARAISDRLHLALTGRPTPDVDCQARTEGRTPTGRLDLRPGELVRVRSVEEIVATLDAEGKNRGLSFVPDMTPVCGTELTVRGRVDQIIDETNGRLLRMKQPCITLQGAVCTSEASTCRLLCPRAIPSYWRELWLERVPVPANDSQPAAAVSTPLDR